MAQSGSLQVSPQARLYALEELCRRAGLSDAHPWYVDITAEQLVLSRAGSSGRIRFPGAKSALRSDLVVRKSWLRAPDPSLSPSIAGSDILDFVVPYCSPDSTTGEPLFIETCPGDFRCTEDLLATTALVLSRFEEFDATTKDQHGRFPSASSIARRDGYLDRPIVDEYGLALEQILAILDLGHRPQRRLRVKVSHDVDLIGIPFGLREPAVQALARRKPGFAIRDLLSGFTGVLPGSLVQVMQICEMVTERGLRSALYWKASARTAFDSGYDIRDPRVAQVMDWARSHDIELGVHPGYHTLSNPEELRREVDRCRESIGADQIGGRQHYLRWSPQTWQHWEQCGLAYDSTVGYSDSVGFRAGTCWPYQPWLWRENRRARLLEIPLLVMDQTLVSPQYMGLSPEESLAAIKILLRRCAAVGGVFTLLWHNNCLGYPYSRYVPPIFDAIAGMEHYDWKEGLSGYGRSSLRIRDGCALA